MFLPFFDNLRNAGVPVSLREFLSFLEGMKAGLATYDIEAFYFLARTIMVKDERHLDKFDRAFAATFEGLDAIPDDRLVITESGIHSIDEVNAMRERNVHSFLVGEAFMRADEPGEKLRQLFFPS